MRQVFYDSRSLGKAVYLADLQELTRNDLSIFGVRIKYCGR